ncbi:MAG: cytidine deaminase [Eubacteriaceae bacterium]|nr:cytidine deaminase [Eubacteriaceae bacterium]
MNDIKDELCKVAVEYKEKAYAPYSGFRVGAAILASGKVFGGANVENASYPAGICAERVAGSKAVTGGAMEFEAIAVACDTITPVYPCGVCRQFLGEFIPTDCLVLLIGGNGDVVDTTFNAIFPNRFLAGDMRDE